MPPKKPALPNARRALAMGSHQILFSSPIEGVAEAAVRSRSRTRPSQSGAAPARERSSSRARPLASDAVVSSAVPMGKRRGTAAVPVPPPTPPPLAPPRVYEELTEADGVEPSAALPGGSSLRAGEVGGGVGRLSAARVTRLLKNARATVQAPHRPETPLDLLRPTTDRGREAFLKGGVRVGRHRPDGSGAAAPGRRSLPLSSLIPGGGPGAGSGSSSSALAADVAAGRRSTLPLGVSEMNPDNFLSCLVRAEGRPGQQMALLQELSRWLANPQHTMRREWMEYCSKVLAAHNARGWGSGEGVGSPVSAGDVEGGQGVGEALAPVDDDTAVAVVMTSVLLHNCSLVSGDDGVPLAEMTRLLRRLTTPVAARPPSPPASPLLSSLAGSPPLMRATLQQQQQHTAVVQWLERELIFEPLLQVAASEWVVTHQPHVAVAALEALCGATRASASVADDDMSGSPRVLSATERSGSAGLLERSLSVGRTAQEGVLQHLVTVGAIPALNTLMRRLLSHLEDSAAMRQRSGGSTHTSLAAPAAALPVYAHIPELLTAVCLLLRNLGVDYGHLLLKLGTPALLVSALEAGAHSAKVTAAVAGTLASLADDPACLHELQRDTRLLRSSLAALSAQLLSHGEVRGAGPASDGGVGDPHTATTADGDDGLATSGAQAVRLLSLARLCSLVSQVTEENATQQGYLAQHGTEVELGVLRFVTAPERLAAMAVEEKKAGAAGCGEDVVGPVTSVVQGALWLVGVTAIGEACPLPFVEEAATLISHLLKYLVDGGVAAHPRSAAHRLTIIYALMCLSNLSFYFPAIEARSDSGPLYLQELYGMLGFLLASILVGDDVEATVEATRTLGNVSFTNTGRDWMESNKCDEVVILFLGHEDLRVVYNSFGIMLNLTAATTCRAVSDEPELLRMLLQYTGRYTSRPAIDAAAREGAQVMQRRASSSDGSSAPACAANGQGGLMEVAQGYAEQIADLVDKCLSNIRGLLQADQPSLGVAPPS